MDRIFERGERVLVRGKSGRINYKRMAPPDYRRAQAYSVVLDERAADPAYRGNIFQASDVRAWGDAEKIGSDDALGG